MCHLAPGSDKELVLVQKVQFTENTGRIFEDKLRQGKSWNVEIWKKNAALTKGMKPAD